MGGEAEEVGPLDGFRVVDSPILILVCFHKALRQELAQLHRLASTADARKPKPEGILDLLRGYRFLQLVYKYHCAAEDEVIFQALDHRVRNVACSYSLEHRTINDLFDSVFNGLNDLLKYDGDSSKSFQELIACTGTIQASICQHMLKEEEQVFPLLMQRFSPTEQASLVWQFLCSVPIMLLEDFLPWMTSYLSSETQADIIHCIKEIVPKEKLLQKVVISWLGKKILASSLGVYIAGKKENVASKKENVASQSDESLNLKATLKIYSTRKNLSTDKCHKKESDCLQNISGDHPVDGLYRWNRVIREELKEILEALHEIRKARIYSTLYSVTAQIKFLADILIFYGDALEKVFFPALNELADGLLSFSHQRFPEENHIESLFHVLQNFNTHNEESLFELVEKLCWEMESFMKGICQHFTFQEYEVFPFVRKNCNHEMQRGFLYRSLKMVPLGLLKCLITWFSAHLTEDEAVKVLCGIKLAGPTVDIAFTSLLHEWVCMGYSGKTPREIFRKELQEMFKNRSSFVLEEVKEGTGFPYAEDLEPCKRSHADQLKAKHIDGLIETSSDLWLSASDSSSFPSPNIANCSTSYSSGINLQIYFSEALKKISPFFKCVADDADTGSSVNLELKPIDHIFHFHKALENDLEYLVTESAKMADKVEVKEFRQRFHLLRILCQAHSDAEDEIAFPALEAKGTLQNITHSYSIDHKLEDEHFRKISTILDEISEVHNYLISGVSDVVDVVKFDRRMLKYQKLCMQLHGLCKSMRTTLGQHVHREEIELWPLFLEHVSEEEQEKIIGRIIGRTRAEILQKMIPWLMASLAPREQHIMMSSWHKAAKNTMFDEWLREWWEVTSRNDISTAIEEQNFPPSGTADSLEIVAAYLLKEGFKELARGNLCDEGLTPQTNSAGTICEVSENVNEKDQEKTTNRDKDKIKFSECTKFPSEKEKQRCQEIVDVPDRLEKSDELASVNLKSRHFQEQFFSLSQEDLDAAVIKISHDTALDPSKMSYLIQNLLMSRWILTQQKSSTEALISSDGVEIPGHCTSYRDPLKLSFGCEHYKRNCKLLAGCCNKLFTCRYCHDNVSDHLMERKSALKMMCMKCLHIQPIGPRCSNHSCNGLSMGRYFCNICKLFDDERDIYHCPFCNLCRVGKGLGIDYFHCMNCNACMSKSLPVHICREKCFESNCPICHDDIFSSRAPVKALPCGHFMHSTCFQDYTCIHYTCPICSKSLGDMQVYFAMLDALLAEEKVPSEYCGQTQGILCNDCGKRGVAPFHWLYHKCPLCGSYNTRLL